MNNENDFDDQVPHAIPNMLKTNITDDVIVTGREWKKLEKRLCNLENKQDSLFNIIKKHIFLEKQ